MDITPTWLAMIDELIGMVQAGDSSTTPNAYDWAMEELARIGQHLDELPEQHRLAMAPPKEFFAAKRELLDA